MPKRVGSQELNRLTINYTGPEHVGGAFDVSRRFGTNGEWGVRINGTARQGDVAIDDEFRSSRGLSPVMSRKVRPNVPRLFQPVCSAMSRMGMSVSRSSAVARSIRRVSR